MSGTELLDDRGEAAASEEFFRSRRFLEAEGVTHSLRLEAEAGTVTLPLIVREVADSGHADAISPYGYPGGEVDGSPPSAQDLDWSGSGLVSIFVRDRVGEASLRGGTERSQLQIADPDLPPKSRMSDRQQVRKNEQRGYSVRAVGGPDSSQGERAAFHTVYEQTMDRTGAGERYYFPGEYFDAVLASEGAWLFLCAAPAGKVAAASIAVLSDGFVHYFLSGTSDEHLRDAPMKNLLVEMVSFATELGQPLNLGGGITPGDGLEEFKRGFANRQLPFVTHEIVCDPDEYARLSAGRGESDFFPAYRS